MKLQRGIANFLIRTCGLRHLYGGVLQRGIRTFLDEIDFQHLRDSQPCECCPDRQTFYEYINARILDGSPIDFLEFGVYRGESIQAWTQLNQDPKSRFFGFDSFEGLPEKWRATQDKGHFDLRGTPPQIYDERVVFLKGWFDDTVPRFARDFTPKSRLVVHLDADLYSSTLLPLIYLKSFLVPGAVLIFDEFYDRNHEFKAFQDYLKVSKSSYRVCCQMSDYGKVCVQFL